MLNDQGDVTITWTEDEDEKYEKAIEAKMAEGCVFFMIEERSFPPRLKLVKTAADKKALFSARAAYVKDKHFSDLLGIGSGDVAKTPEAPVRTIRKAKTAKEASQAQTVGVRPLVGG